MLPTSYRCRLPGSNVLFGLPVVMDTHDDSIKEGSRVLLTYKGQDLGLLEVESKWAPNKVGNEADSASTIYTSSRLNGLNGEMESLLLLH